MANSTSTNTATTPADLFAGNRRRRDVRDITAHVMRTKGLGHRAARRYVERRLNDTTLANWRTTNRFPVGFRATSKGTQPD